MTTHSPPCVLAIDDEDVMRPLYCELLEMEGYGALTLSGAESDLDAILARSPDLIILDLLSDSSRPRRRDGWELLQQIKTHPATASVPVVLCTAAVNGIYDRRQWLRELNVAVVTKPFDIDRLIEAIADGLRYAPDHAPSPLEDSTQPKTQTCR